MDKTTLLYDVGLKRPACVLLQAVAGCGSSPAFRHFDSRDWLTSPSPGMRLIEGSDEEWRKAAELTKRCRK